MSVYECICDKSIRQKRASSASYHGGKMEHPEYQDCLDLMSFYEVYCSPERGVIEGGIDGYIVMVCVFAIVVIVAEIVRGENEKP